MWTEAANYLLFTNPISQGVVKSVTYVLPQSKSIAQQVPPPPPVMLPLWKLAGVNLSLIRLAGLSGAAAVALGAYGAHRKYPDESKIDLRQIFHTANRMHFFHSLALLSTPLVRRPMFTGSMFIVGTTLFCFPCYYRSFTEDDRFNKLAPIGGFCLILAWLSMVI